MAKGSAYTAGGPMEAIAKRLTGEEPVTKDQVRYALERLDSYYRERLDGYGQRITELRDELRRRNLRGTDAVH